MEEIKLKKNNGATVPCLTKIPKNPKAIVIMVHGFTSNKRCATAELLFRRFPERNIGVITYDQPAHGSEEAKEDPLRIENCKDSLACVENYIAENYQNIKIYYFASSYGAYITCLYISTRKHLGKKAFLRSAAVNMPELILGPSEAEPDANIIAELDKKGYIEPDLGLGAIIKIPKGFFEDLKQNNLFEIFNNDFGGHTEVELIHGEKDPVVAVHEARRFAKEFNFKITVIEGEGHSLCNEASSPDKVADIALKFLEK